MTKSVKFTFPHAFSIIDKAKTKACLLKLYYCILCCQLLHPLSQLTISPADGIVLCQLTKAPPFFSQPKALSSRVYFSKLRRASCSEESHFSFCCLLISIKFLVAASNLFFFIAIGLDRVVYRLYAMLSHL